MSAVRFYVEKVRKTEKQRGRETEKDKERLERCFLVLMSQSDFFDF